MATAGGWCGRVAVVRAGGGTAVAGAAQPARYRRAYVALMTLDVFHACCYPQARTGSTRRGGRPVIDSRGITGNPTVESCAQVVNLI